jgi:hypothetical protein
MSWIRRCLRTYGNCPKSRVKVFTSNPGVLKPGLTRNAQIRIKRGGVTVRLGTMRLPKPFYPFFESRNH